MTTSESLVLYVFAVLFVAVLLTFALVIEGTYGLLGKGPVVTAALVRERTEVRSPVDVLSMVTTVLFTTPCRGPAINRPDRQSLCRGLLPESLR